MLTRLLAAVAADDGRPVRLATLAQRLDAEPAVVAAMLDHAHRRGLLAHVGVLPGDAAASDCAPSDCATSTAAACRRCPMAPAVTA